MPPLLVTPDLCGLNTSPEIKIGHLETLLPSLASLLSLLHLHSPLQSSDHTHQTRPLPHGRLEDYATRHLLTLPTAVPEKLPSWVPIPSHVVEWSMGDSHIPIPTDIGTSICNIRLSLEATIRKIQEILPSGWTKETVSERLSHHQNSLLAFQHFMTSETSQMTSALSAINSSLSSLSLVLQTSSRGDPHSLSSHLSLLTLSLLSHRVPSFWVQSVGTSAAPQNWPLGEWVRDLALRRAFLDQVLTVGVAKVPAYWLGAFFNPRAFLSVVTQVGKG
ncbi:Dynein heavy chain 6, axonemal [Geodia barretti]|uniref:Dynein heavy chain 6, axonemal n=1 Tax=Geodia barretti TaxID=519541 RepID=A0AA35RNQ5_GEOBA|nr:Dynein heavy chain 6, axonemal [Geodia barretti]